MVKNIGDWNENYFLSYCLSYCCSKFKPNIQLVKVWQHLISMSIIVSIFVSRPKNVDILKCFEHDEPPVNVEEIFENECCDKSGVLYPENSTLTSCCQCLV